jgi:hypothetical protein
MSLFAEWSTTEVRSCILVVGVTFCRVASDASPRDAVGGPSSWCRTDCPRHLAHCRARCRCWVGSRAESAHYACESPFVSLHKEHHATPPRMLLTWWARLQLRPSRPRARHRLFEKPAEETGSKTREPRCLSQLVGWAAQPPSSPLPRWANCAPSPRCALQPRHFCDQTAWTRWMKRRAETRCRWRHAVLLRSAIGTAPRRTGGLWGLGPSTSA